MFKNYLKIASRIILRQKSYSFINISGLAVGLASCILIMLWVQDELSFDRFLENSENIYLLYNVEKYNDGAEDYFAHSSARLKENLINNYPEIKEIVRIRPGDAVVRYQDKAFREKSIQFVDEEFFSLFSFKIIKGNKQHCLSDLSSIVVSEEMAGKYFGSSNPIGKTLKLDDHDYVVTAVAENVPLNSTIEYDFLVRFENLNSGNYDLDSWTDWAHFYYLYMIKRLTKNNLKRK